MRSTITLISLLFSCQVIFAGENADTVERFIAAFNQHNIDVMLEFSAADMRWMSVSGEQISIETSTHAELRQAMGSYFESTPSARAEVRSISESGSFVSTLEEAFWSSGGAEKSRCSMAVYELFEQQIQNVWYFPADQCS